MYQSVIGICRSKVNQLRLACLSVVLMACAANTAGATRNLQQPVEGTVYDETNSPFQGATVRSVSGSTETLTNEQGSFRITAVVGDTLIFSFLGYESDRLAVDGKPMTVHMVPGAGAELEAVVIVGYGTQKESDLTGAVAAVVAKQLTNLAPSNLPNT